VREQVEALKDHSYVAALARGVAIFQGHQVPPMGLVTNQLAIHVNRARIRSFKMVNTVKQSALTRS
jgi:hypothetical protein